MKNKIQTHYLDFGFLKDIFDKHFELIGSKKYKNQGDEKEIILYRTDDGILFPFLIDEDNQVCVFQNINVMSSAAFKTYCEIIDKYNEIADLEENTKAGQKSVKKFLSI